MHSPDLKFSDCGRMCPYAPSMSKFDIVGIRFKHSQSQMFLIGNTKLSSLITIYTDI